MKDRLTIEDGVRIAIGFFIGSLIVTMVLLIIFFLSYPEQAEAVRNMLWR